MSAATARRRARERVLLGLYERQLTGNAEDVLRSFARSIAHPAWFCTGKGGHGVLVLGPEHAGFCIAQGWTQQAVREYVYEHARISAGAPCASPLGQCIRTLPGRQVRGRVRL